MVAIGEFERDGWFCIKCHFSNKMCFRFGTVGWYCVTKGRYLLEFLFFASALNSFSFVKERQLVRRSFRASPFPDYILTPGGWLEEK